MTAKRYWLQYCWKFQIKSLISEKHCHLLCLSTRHHLCKTHSLLPFHPARVLCSVGSVNILPVECCNLIWDAMVETDFFKDIGRRLMDFPLLGLGVSSNPFHFSATGSLPEWSWVQIGLMALIPPLFPVLKGFGWADSVVRRCLEQWSSQKPSIQTPGSLPTVWQWFLSIIVHISAMRNNRL